MSVWTAAIFMCAPFQDFAGKHVYAVVDVTCALCMVQASLAGGYSLISFVQAAPPGLILQEVSL